MFIQTFDAEHKAQLVFPLPCPPPPAPPKKSYIKIKPGSFILLAASTASCRATLCPETLPPGLGKKSGGAQAVPWLAPTEPYFTPCTSQQDVDADRHLESPQEFHQCFVLFYAFHARGIINMPLWLRNSAADGVGLL